MVYKGTRKALPQIARELHVGAVVEGTVLRERRSGPHDGAVDRRLYRQALVVAKLTRANCEIRWHCRIVWPERLQNKFRLI
jgi:hypothetical protein